MEVELLPTIPKINGFIMFADLLRQRIEISKNSGQPVFIDEFQIREDIYGMSSSYSAGYTVLRGLEEIIQGSGVFSTPGINSNSWTSWNASVKTSQGPRGFIGMRDFASNDIIVDMCTNYIPVSPPAPPVPPYRRDRRPARLKNETPPPDKSYQNFNNAIEIKKDMPAARQSPTQYPYSGSLGSSTGSGGSTGSIVPPLVPSPPNAVNGTTFEPQEGKAIDDTIQQSGGANCTVTMSGYCERVGYEVPRPRVVQIGDLTVASGKVVETSVAFKQAVKAVYFGVPVVQAAWSITYMLTNTPSFLLTPHNVEDFATNQWIG
jgi:hypothetical protein